MAKRSYKHNPMTATGAIQDVAGANVHRVGVILTVSGDGTATIDFGVSALVAGSGFTTHQRGGPIHLTVESVGELIQQPIKGVAAGAITYNVTEIFES